MTINPVNEGEDADLRSLSTEEISTRNYLKTNRDIRGVADMQGGPGPLPAKLSNFEDLTDWVADSGSTQADTSTVYRGSQSCRVAEFPYTIRYTAPSALDLSDYDLSFAINPDSRPLSCRIRYVDGQGNNADYFQVIQSDHPSGWNRIDPSPVIDSGFDLTDVVEIWVTAKGSYNVDSLRFDDKRFDRAKWMFWFDDCQNDIYNDFYPVLDEYGYTATVAIPADLIGDSGRLTDNQIQELVRNGWNVAAHTLKSLQGESEATQRDILRSNKSDLMARGYGDIRSFAYPGGNFDTTTVEVAQEYYGMGLTAIVSFKSAGFLSMQSNPFYLNRRKFEGVGTAEADIENAISQKSVAATYAHNTDEMSVSELESVCQYLDDNSESIDVVAVNDILPDYQRDLF